MSNAIISAVVEIGTSKIKVLIGELLENGRIRVLGVGERESKGVLKGEIVNNNNLLPPLTAAFEDAERDSNIRIMKAYVAVSNSKISITSNSGKVPVSSESWDIRNVDILAVKEIAFSKMYDNSEFRVLHEVAQLYTINDDKKVTNPLDIYGSTLALDALIIRASLDMIKNTMRVISQCHVEIGEDEISYSPVCDVKSVLTPEQKRNGVVMINFGAGKTDYAAYACGVQAAFGTLGVGSSHINSDLTEAFCISNTDAEKLKKTYGIIQNDTGDDYVELSTLIFNTRNVKISAVQSVIYARVEEILRIIKNDLQKKEILPYIKAGIVLTGGGSNLLGLKNLTVKTFDNVPASTAGPFNIEDHEIKNNPAYSTVCGLLQHSLQEVKKEDEGKTGFWKRMFDK
jgi:cell division protein FtsA